MPAIEAISTVETGRRFGVWPLVLFTGLVWGSSALLSKGLVDDGVDSFAVTGVPFLVGGVTATIVAAALGRLRRSALGAGLVLGAVNSAIPALCFNLGYESLPAGIVALLLSLGPVFTAIAAHFTFDDERFRAVKGVGLAMAVAGVAVLSIAPDTIVGGASYRGAAIVVTGAVVAGVTAVLARRFAMLHGARALVAPQLVAAGITPLALGAILSRPLVPPGGFETWHVVSFVAIGLVASYGGFRSIMAANEIGTTGQVSVVGYVIPVIGVAGGIIFFDDALTLGVIIGGGLILLAIAVIGTASGKPARLARTSG